MCIAFVLWQCHPHYRFFLALNRDELLSRPTLAVHWWPEQDNILAGQDLSKGGTWFGCTKNGRVALVTSVREIDEHIGTTSRGDLVTSFLKGSKAPSEYVQEVSEAGDNYNGFNLLVADLCTGSMAYVSNRPRDKPVLVQSVGPGFHILSNASLNTPWPKVLRGHEKLAHLVEDSGDSGIRKEQVIKELLMDDTKADRASLPQTGYEEDWEHKLSSICVDCVSRQGYLLAIFLDLNLHPFWKCPMRGGITIDTQGYVKRKALRSIGEPYQGKKHEKNSLIVKAMQSHVAEKKKVGQ